MTMAGCLLVPCLCVPLRLRGQYIRNGYLRRCWHLQLQPLSSFCCRFCSITAQIYTIVQQCNNKEHLLSSMHPTDHLSLTRQCTALLTASCCLRGPAGCHRSMNQPCVLQSVSCTASTSSHVVLRLEHTSHGRAVFDKKIMSFGPVSLLAAHDCTLVSVSYWVYDTWFH